LYAEGWRAERFDDAVTARRRYEEVLTKADAKDVDQRAYATLARRGLDRIKSASAAQAKLDRAAQLVREGQLPEARQTLNDMVTLYGNDTDLASKVEQARERLKELNQSGGASHEK
jgi:predicted negative regulator of RcsB-dependent stress response